MAAGPAAPRRSLAWPLIGGAALLVNVVLISLLLWPASRTPKQPVAKESSPPVASTIAPPPTAVGPATSPPAVPSPAPMAAPPAPDGSTSPPTVAAAPVPAPAAAVVPPKAPESVEPPAGRPKPAQKLERPQPPGRRDVTVAPPAGPLESAPTVRTPAAVTPPSAVTGSAERKSPAATPTTVASGLPAGVPRLKLEVLVYSDSAPERFVFINGRKYKEGQRMDEGLVLERIQQNGAVLSYEGQTFVLRE